MAEKKISELTAIISTELADDDNFLIVDTSETQTKKISKSEMVSAFAVGANADTLDGQDGTYYLDYNNFTNTPTIPSNNNELTNGAGYITSADGGNAQTIDSLDSTQFLRSDAADTKTSGDLTFSDGIKAIFGTDTDAELYFDNANSDLILNIATDSDFNVMHGTEKQIVANDDGGVELYYNGTIRLNTTFDGTEFAQTIKLLQGRSILFEGATNDANETTLTVIDPTSDNTVSLPDASGTVPVFTTAPTGAIADGTNGQVLTTDGAGGLSFTTASGGGGGITTGKAIAMAMIFG